MLQQTQAARVEPIFAAFMRGFPSVRALAASPRADALRAWAGLGYNRRAVALHRAAQAVVAEHGGRVPVDPVALRSLPGVGPYTAAAVASIAGGQPVAAIDVNVRRIVGRVGFGVEAAPTGAVDAAAARWLDRDDPGRWNQALMDLGREHCRAQPRWARSMRVPHPHGVKIPSKDRRARCAAGSSTCCGRDARRASRRSPWGRASRATASTPHSLDSSATVSWSAGAAAIGCRRSSSA
jgi:endonuclease III